jgi:hypothetical protein
MKTSLVFLVLLIVCFACETNNKPLSDAQKEKIKAEVIDVVNIFNKGCEEVNPEILSPLYLNSPDFIYMTDGKIFNYQESVDNMKLLFNSLVDQKETIINEKYVILDDATVLFTQNSKWLMNFKDGHSVMQDPWIMQLVFMKIDGKWKVISGNESGTEKAVKGSSTAKKLNQVELMKQWIGIWKADMGKDTTFTIECKSFNKGFEYYLKQESKGKLIVDWKTLVGYDKKTDRLIESLIFGGDPELQLCSMWFTTSTKCEEYLLEDLPNPDKARESWTFEFRSPKILIWTSLVNNKPAMVYTFHREK